MALSRSKMLVQSSSNIKSSQVIYLHALILYKHIDSNIEHVAYVSKKLQVGLIHEPFDHMQSNCLSYEASQSDLVRIWAQIF